MTTPFVRIIEPHYGNRLLSGQTADLARVLARGGVVWVPSDCTIACVAAPESVRGMKALDKLTDHAGVPIPMSVAGPVMAATILRFTPTVHALTRAFWPGRLGITGAPARGEARRVRRLAEAVHAPGPAPVLRMTMSLFENDLSNLAGTPLPSAALRLGGAIVDETYDAYKIICELVERTPGIETVFVKGPVHPGVTNHSTIVEVDDDDAIKILRHGSVPADDVFKARPSADGIDWGDAT
jgi:tRNA A37 threonylcarbamoyladenosine synthetase subunit TsaC/SUA5/YrdC